MTKQTHGAGRWCGALVVVLAFGSFGLNVHASPTGSGGLEPSLAVLELYVGEEGYDKTTEYVVGVAEELSRMGTFALLDRSDAQRAIAQVMTTSVRRVTDERLERIARLMKRGEDLLYKEPREAITILAGAKRELHEIMESISQTQKIRDDYFKTQMLLARSHNDNGNPAKAAEIIEEIIQLFGDEVAVTEEQYHPDIVALYRASYRKLSSAPKGSLKVVTQPPGAEILVHGKLQGQKSPATIEGIYPGTVAIQARYEGRESMIRKVRVEANDTSSVAIDIDYETSLSFNALRFGFNFPDRDTLRRRMGDFATRIGKLLSVDKVLVSGLVDVNGRTHLEGYLVDVAKGTVERTESLFTKPNVVSKNRVRMLANFIAKGVKPTLVYKDWYTNWVGWTGVGVGLAASALGVVFYLDYEDKMTEVSCAQPPPVCRTDTERGILASEAKSSRALAVTSFILSGAALIGGSLAFVLMKEEDLDAAVPTADLDLKLRSLSPIVMPDGSPGLGASFGF